MEAHLDQGIHYTYRLVHHTVLIVVVVDHGQLQSHHEGLNQLIRLHMSRLEVRVARKWPINVFVKLCINLIFTVTHGDLIVF